MFSGSEAGLRSSTLFRYFKDAKVVGMLPLCRCFQLFDPRGMSRAFRRWLGIGVFYDAVLLLSLYGSGLFERLSGGFQTWANCAVVIAVAWFSHVALLGITFGVYAFRAAEIGRLLCLGLLCALTAAIIPFAGVFCAILLSPLLVLYAGLGQATGQAFAEVLGGAILFVILASVGAAIGCMAHSLRTAIVAHLTVGSASGGRDGVTRRADILGAALCAVMLFGAPIIVGLFFKLAGISTSGQMSSAATPWMLTANAALSLFPHLFLTGRDLLGEGQNPLVARQILIETENAEPFNISP